MKHFSRILLALLITQLSMAPALAEKPEWAGQGHGKKHRQDDRDDRDYRDDQRQRYSAPQSSSGVSVDIRIGGYFDDHQRIGVQSYYRDQGSAAHCPPGLAKKRNGCLPPGQAKKWRTGYPLPADVVYAPVDARVQVRLGLPPAGHQFVQVAGGILLMAIGTRMVVDAIEGPSR